MLRGIIDYNEYIDFCFRFLEKKNMMKLLKK